MTVSEKGIEFIKSWEAFRPVPYLDSAGLATWGYGHKAIPGEVYPDHVDEITALSILQHDLMDPQRTISMLVKVTIDQGKFDALTSFTMNVGMGNFRSSTLLKFLNGGSLEQAASEFERWSHVKGFVSAGLLARRQAERAMFLTGVYQMHV